MRPLVHMTLATAALVSCLYAALDWLSDYQDCRYRGGPKTCLALRPPSPFEMK